VDGFDQIAGLVVAPMKIGTVGFGVYRVGSDLLNETVLSAGFANKFGIAALGVKLNYVQYSAEGFGTAGAFTVSFGGIAQLTEVISIGASITNINQPVIGGETGERIPTYLNLGVGFQLSEKLVAVTEVEQDLDYDIVVRSGVEYTVHKKVIGRFGVNLYPRSVFGGVGFKMRRYQLDYAVQHQVQFGFNHEASLSVRINNKAK
jgi:hypothetical protein